MTLDSDCHQGNILGHNRDAELEDNLLPLSPPGVQPSVISIGFYPDWLVVQYLISQYDCILILVKILQSVVCFNIAISQTVS